jgi:hypothetical protein
MPLDQLQAALSTALQTRVLDSMASGNHPFAMASLGVMAQVRAPAADLLACLFRRLTASWPAMPSVAPLSLSRESAWCSLSLFVRLPLGVLVAPTFVCLPRLLYFSLVHGGARLLWWVTWECRR